MQAPEFNLHNIIYNFIIFYSVFQLLLPIFPCFTAFFHVMIPLPKKKLPANCLAAQPLVHRHLSFIRVSLHHTAHIRCGRHCRSRLFDICNNRFCCQQGGCNTRCILQRASGNLCRIQNTVLHHIHIFFL